MLAALAAMPAMGEPRSIEDCEKIQAADAYNQCLASFGPVAHERGVTADPEGGGGGRASLGASAETRVSRGYGSRVSHARGHQYGSHRYYASRHQAARHDDPWANMRHTAGRHRAEFRVR
jgi:hypothetical protein